ncbi:hypothetical protein JHW45_06245 [Paracoccus stylophorae]|uniref:Uncharacterized protein n=1 Tax=Paracoccus stylophorae TaxID=659350 RepID=A0ABY7SY55_9RHOB|nr:hypothetical protein [Paracoccus stylophorae]WCR11954.1 hypothetical protein JHW45_06245 [Paracoccus stylophorae]
MATDCLNAADTPAASFRDVYGATEAEISTLNGLATALHDLARECNAIDHAGHDTMPLMALIDIVERTAKEVKRLHAAEHDVYMAERRSAA